MVRTQVPSYARAPMKADAALESPRSFLLPQEKKVAAKSAPAAPSLNPAAAPQQDVSAMQAEIKALEVQLARARQQQEEAARADPDGDYVEESYNEEEVVDDDGVYVMEEIVDDGTEFSVEIVEVYDDDGNGDDDVTEEIIEEVIEDEEEPTQVPQRAVAPAPAAPAARPPNPFMGGGDGRSALLAAIRGEGNSGGPVLKATPQAASAPPAAAKSAGPPAPRASNAPAPRQQNSAPGNRPAISLSSVKLKPTGINLAEAPSESPYTPQGPPPKPQPARGPPPKAVPARNAPKQGEKPKNFLGVATQEEKAEAAAQAKAHQADEAAGEPRKKWIPMKDRNPEKYPKNSIEAREMPKKKTTKLVPLPFRQRQYPKVNPSDPGQETPMEKMLGPYLYKNVKMEHVTVNAALKDQDIVCLYFGASWRSGCKAFHQQLIDFYKLCNKDCQMECVYVSADRTLFEFKDIFQRYPFLAMPTGTVELKNKMTQDFQITDMPALIVLHAPTGRVISANGVEEVSNLPSRDRALAQNLVQEWKARPASSGRSKASPASKQQEQPQEQSPAPAAKQVAAPAAKSVGRKEKKGLVFWKKQ